MDRKVIRQSRMMAAKTHISIGNWASETASLVAAMTPTLPVASRNLRSSVAVLVVEFLDRGDHPVDGLGLVVDGVDVDRHDAAVAVEQPGGGVDVGHRLGHGRRVARQLAPLEAALVPAGVDDLGDPADAEDRLDTLDVADRATRSRR